MKANILLKHVLAKVHRKYLTYQSIFCTACPTHGHKGSKKLILPFTITVHKVNTHYRQFNDVFAHGRKPDNADSQKNTLRTCKLLAHRGEAGSVSYPWTFEANVLTTKLQYCSIYNTPTISDLT